MPRCGCGSASSAETGGSEDDDDDDDDDDNDDNNNVIPLLCPWIGSSWEGGADWDSVIGCCGAPRRLTLDVCV
ncbi:hypothetical protein IAQ61_002306 [Plenodomus lingam]|uniref:uncharacterized protein n=1 Tax=Leptosphaeria maculans TaxID=5022 RepID=UPI0033179728|nr:hypothetical protein IAQ61_002306 [Plenodomus lingam]